MVLVVKNPLAMQETWVQSLGWEDPLEEGTATHSSILAWRIPRTEEPGRLQSIRLQRVRHTEYSIIYTLSHFLYPTLCCFHVLAIVNNAALKIGCMYLFELVFWGFKSIFKSGWVIW